VVLIEKWPWFFRSWWKKITFFISYCLWSPISVEWGHFNSRLKLFFLNVASHTSKVQITQMTRYRSKKGVPNWHFCILVHTHSSNHIQVSHPLSSCYTHWYWRFIQHSIDCSTHSWEVYRWLFIGLENTKSHTTSLISNTLLHLVYYLFIT